MPEQNPWNADRYPWDEKPLSDHLLKLVLRDARSRAAGHKPHEDEELELLAALNEAVQGRINPILDAFMEIDPEGGEVLRDLWCWVRMDIIQD